MQGYSDRSNLLYTLFYSINLSAYLQSEVNVMELKEILELIDERINHYDDKVDEALRLRGFGGFLSAVHAHEGMKAFSKRHNKWIWLRAYILELHKPKGDFEIKPGGKYWLKTSDSMIPVTVKLYGFGVVAVQEKRSGKEDLILEEQFRAKCIREMC